MISKNTTVAKTWKDSQLVGNKKDNKRVFIEGDNIIKHLNGYVIGGKTGNCNVYVRSSHDVKIKCMLEHIRSVTRNKLDLLSSILELMTSHQIKMQKIL